MEEQLMQKKFIALLLFITLLVAGCATEQNDDSSVEADSTAINTETDEVSSSGDSDPIQKSSQSQSQRNSDSANENQPVLFVP